MDTFEMDNKGKKVNSKRSISKTDLSQDNPSLSSKRKKSNSLPKDVSIPDEVPYKSNAQEITIHTRDDTTNPNDMNSTQRITHVSLCCDSGLNCMHTTCKNQADDTNCSNNNNNNNGSKNQHDSPSKDFKNISITHNSINSQGQPIRSHSSEESPRQVASEAGGLKPVQVEQQTFFVDPEVFSQGSEFFNMAWKGSGLYMKEKDGPLVLEETSVSFFTNLVEFFEKGKIEAIEQSCNMETIMEILEGATQYLCPKLTRYSSEVLFKELDANPPSKSILQPLLEFAEFNETFAEHLRGFLCKPKNFSLEYEPLLAFKLFQAVPPSPTEDAATFIKRITPFLMLSRRVERLATLFAEDETILKKDFVLMEAVIANTFLKNKTRLQILLQWRQKQLIAEPQFDHLAEKYIKFHAIPAAEMPVAMVTRYGLDKPINVQYYAQWALMTFTEVSSICSGRHKVRTILTSWLWHVISEDKRFGSYLIRIRIWFRTVALFDQFLMQKSKHLLGRQSLTLSKLQCVGLSCLLTVCRQLAILLPIKDCEKYTDHAYATSEFLETCHEIEETMAAHNIDPSQNALECSGMIESLHIRSLEPSTSTSNNNNNNTPSNENNNDNVTSNENNTAAPSTENTKEAIIAHNRHALDTDGQSIPAQDFQNLKFVIALWAIHMMSWNSVNRSPKDLGVAGAKAIAILLIPDVEVMAVQLRDLLNQFAMDQKYCLLELLDFMKLRVPDFANVTRDFEEHEEFAVFWKHFGGFLKLKKNTVFTFYHNSEQKSPVLSIQI